MLGKELLNKIVKVTNEILFHSNAIDFKSEKLKDSDQEIKYSELTVGTDVFLSSANGDEVAPNDTYTTDSGVSFIVVDGKISEVLENPEPVVEEELADEETAKEDEEKEKEEEELSTDKESELELESKIAELQEQLSALQAELQTEKEKESVSVEEFSGLKKNVISLTELLAAIGKTPSEFSRTDERAEAQDSKNERLKTMASIISKK